jgi:hypothetical protein
MAGSFVVEGRSEEATGTGEEPEVLMPGDVLGEGCIVRGAEVVRAVPSSPASLPTTPMPGTFLPTANQDRETRYEVIRKLGTGSYAVVYLVKEFVSCSSSHAQEVDDVFAPARTDTSKARKYGKEYAIKVLSKKNLAGDELGVQMTEVR